jgi:thioredoxin 1
MSSPSGIAHGISARRRRLVAAVLGLAVVAGSISYVLIERVTAPALEVQYAADADEVQQALRLGKPAVVEFGGNACASCREMQPVLEALQHEHGERISVLNVDILKSRGYISRYKIQLMPTQVFFDAQGREIGRNMGKVSAGEILARLGVSSPERAP